MKALGIIFSDIHEWGIAELTAKRTVASLPFAGRYRLIDFCLSNMVNSGIFTVGVVTKTNYQSLMDHIGSGKDWDLSRKGGGIRIFPPYVTNENDGLYRGRLDALKRIREFIQETDAEFVVLSDCDSVLNIDYRAVMDWHDKNCADITAIYTHRNTSPEFSRHSLIYELDTEHRIKKILIHPEVTGTYPVGLGNWVMKKQILLELLDRAVLDDISRFSEMLKTESIRLRILGYMHKGYSAHIESLPSYVSHNLEMLDNEKMHSLFYNNQPPIYTKVRDSVPTKYGVDACVHNSIIADGCLIEGTVENCVIFRDVHIGKNCVVKNSILMQNSVVGEGTMLQWVVADKNVQIQPHRTILTYENAPFYIGKNKKI